MHSQPTLYRRNVLYHEAFSLLSSGRQNTDSVINPITFSDVMAYCDCINEFDGYERLRYWRMVNTCDVAWITAVLAERVAKADKVAKPK